MTGLSVTQQRNWRRYGYLPKLRGKHARFKPHYLAAMTIMQALSERGIGPSVSHKITPLIGCHVLYYACLLSPDVAFGNWAGLCQDSHWHPDHFHEIAEQVGFYLGEAAIEDWDDIIDVANDDAFLAASGEREISLDYIFLRRGKPFLPEAPPVARYVVWFADDFPCFVDDLSVAFDELFSSKKYVDGACVVMDLKGIATAMLDRTERPLYSIERPSDDDEDHIEIDTDRLFKLGGSDG
jgi:hypothetical protein